MFPRAALLAALLALGSIPACFCSAIAFTGRVDVDFPITQPFNPEGTLVVANTGTVIEFQGTPSGWGAREVRFSYDPITDIAYFGEWCPRELWLDL